MKAVLLAAGEGKRLSPLTETRPKHMIPVAGKPLLQHTLEMLRDVGITDILLIVGYRKEQIMQYFGDGHAYGLQLTYIEQTKFLGTGHAANLAMNFVKTDPFFLIYGDLLMDSSIFSKSLQTFQQGKCDAVIAAFRVPDPQKFGIIKTSSLGFMEQIIEKPPDDQYGNLANAGVYIFSSLIFEGIAATQKSSRGEYELTESMQHCIDRGYKIKVIDVSGLYWSDIGHAWQLLDANHHLLTQISEDQQYKNPNFLTQHGILIEPGVTVHGPIRIGDNTHILAGTYIQGPIVIGASCEIGPNSFLRPFCSIGDYCRIGNGSEVKESILMNHAALPHLSYAGDSIIGENTNFGCGTICANVRLDKQPVSMIIKDQKVTTGRIKMGAVIGDNTSLGIQVSIMPGKTIGSGSQIGANTIITKDIPQNSRVYSEQTLIIQDLIKKKKNTKKTEK